MHPVITDWLLQLCTQMADALKMAADVRAEQDVVMVRGDLLPVFFIHLLFSPSGNADEPFAHVAGERASLVGTKKNKRTGRPGHCL